VSVVGWGGDVRLCSAACDLFELPPSPYFLFLMGISAPALRVRLLQFTYSSSVGLGLLRVHLPGGIQDEIETSRPERKTYFIGVCNKLALDLLPLLVCWQNDILYSVGFEEGLN